MAQSVFKRYELKYILTLEQKERVLEKIAPYIKDDKYGHTTIRNVYYDTDTYYLIRRSMERPRYKEKLRVRSYARAGEGDKVFVELKKKYNSVVYKRREALARSLAEAWLAGGDSPVTTQISREIDYFLNFYKTCHPSLFLSYDRQAYYDNTNSEFRITFDENILCRSDRLSLGEEVGGERVLEEGLVLMELKCGGAIPLWMVKILSEEKIYKTSFSKYGTAFGKYIFPRLSKKESYYV